MRKGVKSSLLLILMIFVTSVNSTEKNSKSAAFYYGPDIPWVELSLFDYAVIEPDQTKQAPVGNHVYAYISIGEVVPTRHYFSKIKKPWLIGKNKAWQAYVLDQSQEQMRDFYIEHVITPLWQRGFRRFFMDTLDSYRLVKGQPESYYQAQRDGIVVVVHSFQRKYAELR